MGKRLITQRRGRGTARYKSPGHRFKGKAFYPSKKEVAESISGQVIEILNDPGRTAPLMKVLLEDFREIQTIAPEGICVGDWLSIGQTKKISLGDILPFSIIPEGTEVCNLELNPGDGGSFARSSGTFASIVSHQGGSTYLKLPSKKTISVSNKCRATIGRAAGSGRKDKPFVHAGQTHYKRKAKNKIYPVVRGVAKNAVNHPHGGGRHPHAGSGSSVSRNAPPGRKVGHIAPKRTGKKKR
ncbi:MAG: 50S ribosomal protein L2 [Candidatus Altiarchaeota archaeon]